MNLDFLRLRLSRIDTGMPWLALLALLTGLLAGTVIVAFRLLVEGAQGLFLPGGDPENYEALDVLWRFTLPVLGGFVLGLAYTALPAGMRGVGVVYVRERLLYHQGRLPLINGLVQFFGAALSIVAGHSVGREGPAVHLGATPGSLLAQYLTLPHNATRILTACGAAGAIGAAFNTPLAGVVFAMEVVLREYTIAGFLPVILASVSATAVSRLVYGDSPAFFVPHLDLAPVAELPWVFLAGIFLGALSVVFVRLLEWFTEVGRERPWWLRLTLAGLAVGAVAVFVPQVMGIGYDTVDAALAGELALGTLAGVTAAKLVATAAGVGLGLPGGLIGPTLVMGATAGGTLGLVVHAFYPGRIADPALYALLGMGAMMGAVLQAPLAALTALLELTGETGVILPGMLAIVAASLTASEAFAHRRSVFAVLMAARGLDYDEHPAAVALRQVGALSAIDRDFSALPQTVERAAAKAALACKPRWILVMERDVPQCLMPAVDLLTYLEAHPEADLIDLMEIPAQRLSVAPLDFQATLDDAWRRLRDSHVETLYVVRHNPTHIYGILTAQEMDRFPALPESTTNQR